MGDSPPEKINTTVLLGAGSSAPLGYPTTNQFLEDLQYSIDQSKEDSFKLVYDLDQVNTIDDFIRQLRDVIDENSTGEAIPAFLSSNERGVSLSNENINQLVENFREFRADCKVIYDEAISMIYEYYSWKEELAGGYQYLKNYADKVEEVNHGPLPIFTTNYDVSVESLSECGYQINNLFDENEQHSSWIGDEVFQSGKKIINLFKLHGSVDWHYRNGDLVKEATKYPHRGAPDESSRELIPPGLELGSKMANDPYNTYFEYFEHYLSASDNLLVIGHSLEDTELVEYIENHKLNLIVIDDSFDKEGDLDVSVDTIPNEMQSDAALNKLEDHLS